MQVKKDRSKIRWWLIILALLSLFTFTIINDNVMFAYEGSLLIFDWHTFYGKDGNFSWLSFFQWGLTFVSACIILLLPVLVNRIKYFKWLLFIAPLIFSAGQTFAFLFIPFTIQFIPFIVVWLTCVSLVRR